MKIGFNKDVQISKVALDYNLAEFLSFETARAVAKTRKFCKSRKLAEINSTTLFYFLLSDNPKLNFIFARALLDIKEIKELLKSHLESLKGEGFQEAYSVGFQNVISESLKTATEKNHLRIEIGDVLAALAKHEPIFQRILIDFKLKTEDIDNLTWWLESIEEKINKRKKFWEYENLMRRGTLAKEWTAGYTINLDRFSIDWTERIRQTLPEIIGHEQEIQAVERILGRREVNNVLLMGDPGTGRKSIIFAVTKRSILGQSLAELNYKRVVELDMPRLLAELPSVEDVETTLDIIFQEAISAGNIILVIDEFHNYIGQISRPGVVDISGVLSSYLHLPQFQIVAITTFAGLHQYIEQNPSVLALFEKVEVSEISEDETLMFLEDLVLFHERKSKRFISYRRFAK